MARGQRTARTTTPVETLGRRAASPLAGLLAAPRLPAQPQRFAALRALPAEGILSADQAALERISVNTRVNKLCREITDYAPFDQPSCWAVCGPRLASASSTNAASWCACPTRRWRRCASCSAAGTPPASPSGARPAARCRRPGPTRSLASSARRTTRWFALLLRGASAEQALAVAQRIRVAVQEASFEAPGLAAPLRMTVSLGVAAAPARGAEAEALVHAADRALYRANAAGRNRAELATLSDCEKPRPQARVPAAALPAA
jgi:hypothetical protein